MASIRRTLSPYHNRPHQNGGSPFSVNSPSHKPLSNGNSPTPLPTFNRLIAAEKYSRKGPHSWRRSIFRCLLFFLLGFILGLASFDGVFLDDDARTRDFSFQITPPQVNVEENFGNLVIPSPKDFVLDYVELAAEKNSSVKERFGFSPRKQLIIVTPTYNRALQAYYLNRLGQVLRLVPPPLIWIVVEMNAASGETAAILREIGVMHRHLVCTMNSTNVKDRGVHQRNTALEHIERHKLDGIVYFADDDHLYALELFESMREISRFGTWPVGMLAQSKNKAVLEGPVCNRSQVIGWHTNEKSKRLHRFHVDMSGFAFNSTILWDPRRWKRPTSDSIRQLDTVKEGFQETTFIEQVVEDESQMEGNPPGCSRIMNWHLHLEAHELGYPGGWLLEKNLEVAPPITLSTS